MRLVIRADASVEIGFGHVMRCVALAQVAAERGLPVVFAGHHADGAAAAIRAHGFDTSSTLEKYWPDGLRPHDVVMFDGYRFTPQDYASARGTGARVGAVDDRGEGIYPVDVLLHQNLRSSPNFEVPDDAVVLIGPRYAMVRQEFRSRRRLRTEGSRLLLTLGGSDAAGLSAQLVTWAKQHRTPWELTVVLGPAASNLAADSDVTIMRAPEDVGAVFGSADVAIAAAGSTTWELSCMGVPSMLIQVADNQRHIGCPVAERGAAVFLGVVPVTRQDVVDGLDRMADPSQRREMSRRALDLVDGRGAERVLDTLLG